MKFDALTSAFDTDRIEKGAWLHFAGPDENPLYLPNPNADEEKPETKKAYPVRARVRSVLSIAYEEHTDSIQKEAANKARRLKGQAQRDAMLAELRKEPKKSFAALVTELENIDKGQPGQGGRPTKSELLAFADNPHNAFWVNQVLEFAADNRNYGGDDAPAVVEGKDEPAVD